MLLVLIGKVMKLNLSYNGFTGQLGKQKQN
jgi:hypothetical protein